MSSTIGVGDLDLGFRVGIWVLGLGIGAASAASSACAAHHQAHGLVLKVDRAAATVTVSHEDIPGYMNAMVMPFTVRDPKQVSDVRPGDRIAFRLNIRDERSWIDRVKLLSAAPADTGLTQSPAIATVVPLGSEVPDFTLTNQNGEHVSLASLRGKVVLVNFWASWCPECRPEMPLFERLHRDFAGRGLAVVGVNAREGAAVVRQYARELNLTFPLLLDAAGEVREAYGVIGLPTTFLIARDGHAVALAVGPRDWSGTAAKTLITTLLAQ